MAGVSWLMPDPPRADIAGQLGGFLAGTDKRDWTDGTVTIPRGRTARRVAYDRRYLEEVRTRFGGPRIRLTPIRVDARKLELANAVVNRERYRMYRKMLQAGDAVPPLIVENVGGAKLRVIDGNHRTQAALDAKRYRLPALLREHLSLMEGLRTR